MWRLSMSCDDLGKRGRADHKHMRINDLVCEDPASCHGRQRWRHRRFCLDHHLEDLDRFHRTLATFSPQTITYTQSRFSCSFRWNIYVIAKTIFFGGCRLVLRRCFQERSQLLVLAIGQASTASLFLIAGQTPTSPVGTGGAAIYNHRTTRVHGISQYTLL